MTRSECGRVLAAATLLSASVLLASAAQARVCMPFDKGLQVLAQRYHEAPLPGHWRSEDGFEIVITGSKPSSPGAPATWTMIKKIGTVGCAIEAGTVNLPAGTGEFEGER